VFSCGVDFQMCSTPPPKPEMSCPKTPPRWDDNAVSRAMEAVMQGFHARQKEAITIPTAHVSILSRDIMRYHVMPVLRDSVEGRASGVPLGVIRRNVVIPLGAEPAQPLGVGPFFFGEAAGPVLAQAQPPGGGAAQAP
jgi:hypothetical protein